MTPTKLKARRKLLEGLRVQLKLNKQQFAAKIGISPSEYSNILAGYRGIPVHSAFILARQRGCTPQEIEPSHKRVYKEAWAYWLNRTITAPETFLRDGL